MTSDRWQRLERLYHAARERPISDRAAFLAEACGPDTELRRDLESLLSQDDRPSFLETRGSAAASSGYTGRVAPFPSSRLRVYEIQGAIGAGGMGEVYRARDTTLNRDVAIKVLPQSVSDDADRRARFEREAHLLAALNHPHIAQIYGFEEFDGGHALVMELVEGETLAEMIAARVSRRRSGALPVAKALALARQITDALDAAHAKGIIHRDLKPSNIKVTPAGVVKVLDFGLAKTVDPAVAIPGKATEISRQPVILGTVPYMSPEQARGEPIDKRSDVWAFGCVLFEMLVGRAPFDADSASETLSRILTSDPDWSRLPAETPSSARRLLERCLRKDPSRRLHDIADARLELDEMERPENGAKLPLGRTANARDGLAWILSLVLVSALVTVLFYRRPGPAKDEPFEFPIEPPTPSTSESSDVPREFAISPDGGQIAVATRAGDTSYLWVRSIASTSWRRLDGTEGASNPFWRPDSRSIGFFVVSGKGGSILKLKTMSLSDGVPFTVCEVQVNRPAFGAWSSRGTIVFSNETFLQRVPDGGGTPTRATTELDETEVHRSPSFLPDGDHFLYLAEGAGGATHELRVGSLSSDATESLGSFDSNAIYASGYLLSVRAGNRLMAQPFDLASRRILAGPVLTLAENVDLKTDWRRAQFSVSGTGRLTYSQPLHVEYELTWFDRDKGRLGPAGPRGAYSNLNMNRDDTGLLVTRTTQPEGEEPNVDIWRIDLARLGAARRLTFAPTSEYDPAWSPDGTKIVFASVDPKIKKGRAADLFRRNADGSGENEPLFHAPALLRSPALLGAPEWSPNGRVLLFTRGIQDSSGGVRRELVTIEPDGDHNPRTFLRADGNAANGSFSPNGRWVAYEADDSEQYEIFVAAFPEGNKRIQISTNGGTAPRWRGDGQELFFLAPDGQLMAVDVDPATGAPKGVPHALFRTGLLRQGYALHPYVVTKDGQRFLITLPVPATTVPAAHAMLSWPTLHK